MLSEILGHLDCGGEEADPVERVELAIGGGGVAGGGETLGEGLGHEPDERFRIVAVGTSLEHPQHVAYPADPRPHRFGEFFQHDRLRRTTGSAAALP